MKVLEYVWGNKLTQTNGRTGTTTYVYEAGTGALLSWEGPGEAGKEQKGKQIYDAYGRAEATELADGTRQYVAYDAEGNVIRQWGSQIILSPLFF